MIPHLATSWNWARVMLGPLNRFTISRIWKEAGEERKEPKKWSCQCWNGFWEVLRGFWGNERREKAKTKKQRRESHHLGVERVLSVASHSVRNSLLWHLARLVHMVPVDLLKHQQFKASAQLISVTWMSAMPLASAILSAWALGRLDEEQSRQTGSRSSSW